MKRIYNVPVTFFKVLFFWDVQTGFKTSIGQFWRLTRKRFASSFSVGEKIDQRRF